MCSESCGVAEVHALGGWGYPISMTATSGSANRMVGWAHYVHEFEFFDRVFLQYSLNTLIP